MQGGKREKACHIILELNLVLAGCEDGRRGSAWAPCHKMDMAIVKTEKAALKEAREAKKLDKQVAVMN